jgi:hypothetical protein
MAGGTGRGGKLNMAVDFFGPGAQPPTGGSVELAGVRSWVRSVLVVPALFVLVVLVCALAAVRDWLLVLTVMSALTLLSEALLVRNGVTSLALSPSCVVRRARHRTSTVRAEEVSDILIRHLTYGPIMVVSSGDTKIGLSLPAVYRNPSARDALASFLWRAGADPSLGEMGIPRPGSRTGAPGDRPTARAGSQPGRTAMDGPPEAPTDGVSAPPVPPAGAVAPPPTAPTVRAKGRALAWVTFAALALTVVIGALRFVH